MGYKIVVDSCCDLTSEMRQWNMLEVVPLSLEIGDYHIFDDENFNQDDFISRMKAYSGTSRSACPAPDAFKEAYEGDENEIYVLTITDKLSGTYNSALQGKMLFEEEHKDAKKIHIFNSLATSGIETLVARKIKQLADSGLAFEDVVAQIEDYIVNHTGLYFCLESLDALKQNGRLFALAATVLQKIRVKLICERTTEGNIRLAGQDITINRAITKMAHIISEQVKDKDLSNETLIISHVCCEERANLLIEKIKDNAKFGKIEVIKASGLNSLYASDGGIIVSYSY